MDNVKYNGVHDGIGSHLGRAWTNMIGYSHSWSGLSKQWYDHALLYQLPELKHDSNPLGDLYLENGSSGLISRLDKSDIRDSSLTAMIIPDFENQILLVWFIIHYHQMILESDMVWQYVGFALC